MPGAAGAMAANPNAATGGQTPQPAQPQPVPASSLADAIWGVESNGRLQGVPDSKAGVIGPMQVTPALGQHYGANETALRDPNLNLELGRRIVSDYSQQYGGDPDAVGIAYNAGPAVADIWPQTGRNNKVLPDETQNYLDKLHTRLAAQAQAARRTALGPQRGPLVRHLLPRAHLPPLRSPMLRRLPRTPRSRAPAQPLQGFRCPTCSGRPGNSRRAPIPIRRVVDLGRRP